MTQGWTSARRVIDFFFPYFFSAPRAVTIHVKKIKTTHLHYTRLSLHELLNYTGHNGGEKESIRFLAWLVYLLFAYSQAVPSAPAHIPSAIHALLGTHVRHADRRRSPLKL